MRIDSLIFSIVFKGIVSRPECREENFVWVLDVMIRVAPFDLFESDKLLVKAVFNYLLLAVGEAQRQVGLILLLTHGVDLSN